MLGSAPPPPFDPGHLRLGSDLRRIGVEPTRDRAGWHQVSHGVWAPRAVWDGLDPGQRHAALVHATVLRCRPEARHVIAAESAAAVWGLPRVERWPDSVRVLVHSRRDGGSSLLRPCLGAETAPVPVSGLLVTPVARTVVDLARTGSLATAVAAADHALRHRLCTPVELAAEVAAVGPRSRGRSAATLVRDLADPASMSAGESLSRVQMFLLEPPAAAAAGRAGGRRGAHRPHGLRVAGRRGEFDGRVKYRVPEGADPQSAGEVVWAEKRREDRLRRRVLVARWVWSVAMDRPALGRVLAEVGVRPQPRCTWFDLGARSA